MTPPHQPAAVPGIGGILNLPLELPHPVRWKGLGSSLAAHVLAALALFADLPAARHKPNPADLARQAVPLFIPRYEPPRAAPARHASFPSSRPAVPEIQADDSAARIKVDMNSVKLSFADDVGNQLPGVVESFEGVLALLDKSDPPFARYLIEPPGWTVRETFQDVSRKMLIEMLPAQKWALLRSVASQHSIALDNYRACALFERSFGSCMASAIREKARATSGGREVRVQSALLAFENGMPCGVNVLEVSFVRASIEKP